MNNCYNHYKQQNGYGCGIYSIANALQDSEILTPFKLEASKSGNNIGQLNKWLWELERNIYIGMVSYNNDNPIELIDLNPNFESDESVLWHPFMIVIKSTPTRNHMIGCRYMRNRQIVVHDSLKDKEQVFDNFDEFKNFYDGRVLSFECFYTFENENVVIIDNTYTDERI